MESPATKTIFLSNTILALAVVIAGISNGNAALIFTFDQANGGSSTILNVSGSATATAGANFISDGSLPFDFVTNSSPEIFDITAGSITLTGTSSGVLNAVQIFIESDGTPGSVGVDNFQISLDGSLQAGETLVGSGSATFAYDFSQFVGGGPASPTVLGADFEIVIGSVPAPTTLVLLGLGLAGLGYRRHKQIKPA